MNNIQVIKNIQPNSVAVQVPNWLAKNNSLLANWSYKVTKESEKAWGVQDLDEQGNIKTTYSRSGFSTHKETKVVWLPKSIVKDLEINKVVHFERIK